MGLRSQALQTKILTAGYLSSWAIYGEYWAHYDARQILSVGYFTFSQATPSRTPPDGPANRGPPRNLAVGRESYPPCRRSVRTASDVDKDVTKV